MRNRVIIIDVETCQVKEGTVGCLQECQAIVGGLIQFALSLPNGDCIFVNEEGLLLRPSNFFMVRGYPHPFALSGYITGIADKGGNTTNAISTLEEAHSIISFGQI